MFEPETFAQASMRIISKLIRLHTLSFIYLLCRRLQCTDVTCICVLSFGFCFGGIVRSCVHLTHVSPMFILLLSMDFRRPEPRDGAGGRRQRRRKWRCSFHVLFDWVLHVTFVLCGGHGPLAWLSLWISSPECRPRPKWRFVRLPFWRLPTRSACFCLFYC